MDALILLGAASGLPPLLPVGDGDQGVTGQPGDSLDIAVALAREAIDGVGSRHQGVRFLVDPGHPQARRRLRDDGKLLVAIGERGIVLELRLLRQADSVRRLPARVARANEHVDTTAPRVAARSEVTLAQGVQILAASAPHVGEALKALVRLFEPGVQPGATEETGSAVVLGDEAAEEPVEVLHRLDQAEARPYLWSMAMSSKPDPKLGAGKSRLLARRLRKRSMRAT